MLALVRRKPELLSTVYLPTYTCTFLFANVYNIQIRIYPSVSGIYKDMVTWAILYAAGQDIN